MRTQVMLDLETLGTRPGSVIVAIGAVKFWNGEILGRFYRRVDAESCLAAGLRMDASTVIWWMGQNDTARLELTRPGLNLHEALNRFSAWVGDPEAEIWGDGAAFDNVLLSDAYAAAQITRPWNYWNDRCYRTARALMPDVAMVRSKALHHALADAEAQALHLMEILSELEEMHR